ncbi:MAG: hypothetical protein IJ949_02030, partial [Oscillospiraceae bacterium]|nr:hypothetical protein [Oscillospiraceae bacterium]
VTVKYGMWKDGSTFNLSLNGTKLGSFNNDDDSASKTPVEIQYTVFESDGKTLFTPDDDGYITVSVTTDSTSARSLWLYQVVIEEIADESASFSFAADQNSVFDSKDKADEYYFSETRASSSLSSKPGYVKFEDDMYFTESSAIVQLRLPNINVYSSTDSTTSLGVYGRYTLISNNLAHFYNYGCMFLKHKLGSDGIYNITVTTGKYKRGGRIAVYANDVYIGNINDYQVNFTGTSTAMSDGQAELHTTDLKAVNLTRDSNGYVEIAFRAIEGEGTNVDSGGTAKNVDFIPYSIEFEKVEAAEVAEPEIVSNTTVAAYVMNDVGGTIAETPVNSGTAGRAVTYTATPVDGYKFVCWTDKDGKVLSEDSAYIFNAYTNMTVYANFDETDAVGVKFYNGNGEFLKFVEKESGKTFAEYKSEAPVAVYDGATFSGWSIADEAVINGVAYAVAQFADDSEETVTATIKINGNPKINGSVAIGTPIVCLEEEATAWYRDGKFVSYGSSYTHYTFKDALLNSGRNAIENKAPVAILDDLGNGSYMFEYDGGDYTVLAAGVVFGNSEDVSVSSCYANAKARNIEDNHGQFKACVNSSGDTDKQSVARGYVIYSDSGKIKVLYGDLD